MRSEGIMEGRSEEEILETVAPLRKMFPGQVWPGVNVMVFSRAGEANEIFDWIPARVVDLLKDGGVRVRLPTGQVTDRGPGRWRMPHPLERLALEDDDADAEGLLGSPPL